jgi:uncharacterized membrane protein YedE/YeeE
MPKTGNIKLVLFTVFIIVAVLSFTVLWLFEFGIAVIFTICLSTAFVLSGITGIENVIIKSVEEKQEQG